MKLIKQIIASFVVIIVIIVAGLSLNLNRLFILTASHQDIEEEWEELEHAVAFQDALNNLINDVSTMKANAASEDFNNLNKKLVDVKKSLSQIKLCSLDLFDSDEEGHQEADEHLAQEEEKMEAMKEKVDQFIKNLEAFSVAPNLTIEDKKKTLQKLSEQLFEIKIINLQLQKVYSNGFITILEMAKKVGKQVEYQIILISSLIILVVILAAIWTVILLRHRANEMIASAKSETIRLLAKSFAHEIRNPLGIIKSSASVIKKESAGIPNATELLTYMIEEVDRIDDLVGQLQNLDKNQDIEKREADLDSIIKQCTTLMMGEINRKKITLDYKKSKEPIMLSCNPNQIKQMLINLLLNAAQASEENGKIILQTKALPNSIEITVQDFGRGIEAKDIKNIFEPFYTTKSTGSGIGLAVVKNIVTNHGGKIEVESTAQGTIFKIVLKRTS